MREVVHACTCRYLCNWSLVSCEAATFLSCCRMSLDTLSCFDACCRRSCYNYKQKTIYINYFMYIFNDKNAVAKNFVMEFLCHVTMIAYTCMEKVCCPWAWPIKSPRRGGGTPYNGLYGEGSPNGVPFSGFKYLKGYRGLTCWSIIMKGYWEIWYCGPWKDLKQVTFSGCEKYKKLSR